MLWNIIRAAIVAGIVVTVGEISKRYPRAGALLLSLPLVSIFAFLVAWFQHHDLKAISQLAREAIILVPLSLPFFLPLAVVPRLGLAFWPSFAVGIVLASLTITAWLALAPRG
jgi:hypothetical protein